MDLQKEQIIGVCHLQQSSVFILHSTPFPISNSTYSGHRNIQWSMIWGLYFVLENPQSSQVIFLMLTY